jgi:alanine racemase
MLSVEWNQEEFYRVGREEGFAEGYAETVTKNITNWLTKDLTQCFTQACLQGMNYGVSNYIESRIKLWKDKMSVDEMSELLDVSPDEVETIIQKLQQKE